MIGSTFSHFKIIAKLGEGGMGEVYRAEDTKLGREVAVKVLPEAVARDAERLARFEREARILAALDHPNIAALYGLEEADGRQLLVLQLIDGETLQERLTRARMRLAEALAVALQIAEGLEAAHAKGIVHRDLKPANVKVTPEGQVKLLDFGLAKALLSEPESSQEKSLTESPTLTAQMTQTGVLLGTAAYMSPEQARGQEADRQSDIWSFGAVLWEMLTGNRLFEGPTVSDTLAAVLTRDPDRGALPEATPPALQRLVGRCLARDPRDRLHDIADARIELQELAAGGHLDAAEKTVQARGWPRAAVLAWVVAGLAAVWALIVSVQMLRRPEAVEPEPIELALAIPPELELSSPSGSAIALSPDGRRLAVTLIEKGTQRLYHRTLEDPTLRPVAGSEGAVHPFFSPDGRWVGFFAADSTTDGWLKKVQLPAGVPISLVQSSGDRGGAWSPDGSAIVYPYSEESGLLRISAEGGEPEVLTTLDKEAGERSHRWPQYLPGGRAILFTLERETDVTFDEARLAILSLETLEHRVILEQGSYGRYLPSGHIVFVRGERLLAVPFDLQRLEIQGSPVTVLESIQRHQPGGGAQLAVAESGVVIYRPAAQEAGRSLAIVGRDGIPSSASALRRAFSDVRLSPDAQKLAVEIDSDLWIYELERDLLTRLTVDMNVWGYPVWSPDGSRLAFSAQPRGMSLAGVFSVPAESSDEPVRLVEPTHGTLFPTSWSPDGRQLLVTEDATGFKAGSDVKRLVLSDPPRLEAFLSTAAVEDEARFSPDGGWVVYVSNESGSLEVYLRRASGEGARTQVSGGGGVHPMWDAEGERLFYVAQDKVMAVDIDLGKGPAIGRPRIVLSGLHPGAWGEFAAGQLRQMQARKPHLFLDVFPDGEHFVFLRPDETAAAPPPVVVLNWFERIGSQITGTAE